MRFIRKISRFYPLTLLWVLVLTGCQSFYQNQAQSAIEKQDYRKAIAALHKCNSMVYSHINDLKIADCFFRLDELDSSEIYYKQVFQNQSTDFPKLPLAITLLYQRKFDEVNALLQNEKSGLSTLLVCLVNSMKTSGTSNPGAKPVIEENELALFTEKDYREGHYRTAISSNSPLACSLPQSSWTHAIYTHLLNNHLVSDETWLNDSLILREKSSRIYDGPATYSTDCQKVYFTRSNLTHAGESEARMKIFSATRIDKAWTNFEEFPFNGNSSTGHPSLSRDSKTLYFASDRPGGFGGFDLYFSELTNGQWSQPKNLGPTINTSSNELFPFIDSFNLLYFASDRGDATQALNVYFSSPSADAYLQALRLNFSAKLNPNNSGFSFDQANVPSIVRITEINSADQPAQSILRGTVTDPVSKAPVEGALIEVSTGRTGELIRIYSDQNGRFSLPLEQGLNYKVYLKNEGCFSKSVLFSTKNQPHSLEVFIQYEAEKIDFEKAYLLGEYPLNHTSSSLSESCKKELDKLIDVLKNNGSLTIQIAAHTHSKEHADYFRILSELRAKTAVEYIYSQGVDPNRLQFKGFGKDTPMPGDQGGNQPAPHAGNGIDKLEFTVVSF